MNPETHITRGEAETRAVAARLAARLTNRAVLALEGELGAGKTCFVRGLAAALGSPAAVTSPTFTLRHDYAGGRHTLRHFDLYRLPSAAAAPDLELDECVEEDGWTVIEWPERAAGLLPPRTIRIRLTLGAAPDERRIEIFRPENAA